MRLYHSPTSPFARKVMVVLRETGLIGQVELVPAGGTPVAPGTIPLERNPLGKIPVLERPEGPALYDSRVICRYLAEMAGGGLYPQARIWETLTLEATADGIMEAAVLTRYESVLRSEESRSAAWTEAQRGKITRALEALDARWMAHLAGPLDCGQIAVGCALGYLDFRLADLGWRERWPALATWASRFAERPSMRETAPAD
ncbi:glutathione S-transferase [Amaricoccus solimangrovi]|uniref:Glutathione S-transferase n=1 Tax=Amaricoccus solimangrovi TaxID=2589815 RepID=A0A501WVB7_9RHOB|nr:glutathione S-transferase [Amaricoccus solimangrovi]TPE52692.1 glutathione S-transferase [Amaricoccus solimangrovi]